MNRFQEDTPYEFHPPQYSKLCARLIYAVSDFFFLRRKHRIAGVKIAAGGDELIRLYKQGHSLLITPNHSDHCDPHALLHLSKRLKLPLHFMAAREIFEKEKGLRAPILQKAGVFSVDREGADLKSIKQAMKLLYDATYPLVMFPEGEIYHLNEKLTPLNEGAATLALRAAKKVKKDKPETRCYIIPTALRYSYIDDISTTFPERLARLEAHILWAPQNHLDIVSRIYKFGEAVLSLKEKEFLNRTLDGSLDERLNTFREHLISNEEKKYFAEIKTGNHPTRVRMLRGKIRSIILASETPGEETMTKCRASLDKLYVAIQLYSYPGQYLREKPSMDRIAETLHKFEEDIFEDSKILGQRSVEITFCKPINLMDRLDDLQKDSKRAVSDVTTEIEAAIQAVLQ